MLQTYYLGGHIVTCGILQDSFQKEGQAVLPKNLWEGRDRIVAKGEWQALLHYPFQKPSSANNWVCSLWEKPNTSQGWSHLKTEWGGTKGEWGEKRAGKSSFLHFNFLSPFQEIYKSLLECYQANQTRMQQWLKCSTCSCLDVEVSQEPMSESQTVP